MNALPDLWRKQWLWIVANLGALYPLARLLWKFATGNVAINPVDDLIEVTGNAAINLLMLSLAATPISTLTGWRRVVTVRKSLGLWAFAYASLHLTVIFVLDYGLNLQTLWLDIQWKRRFIVAGLAALLLMLPLAVTSTKGWMRRLGRNWKRLHRLVYAAGVLAVLHFLWLVKIDRTEPLIYAAILTLLLVLRIPRVRRSVVRLRQSLAKSRLFTHSILALWLVVTVTGCGRGREEALPTQPPATATPVSATQLMDVNLLDVNLLEQSHAAALCDQNGSADFTCDQNPGRLRLQVNVGSAHFARWSWRLAAPDQPLNGSETLLMTAARSGELAPNLYFVYQDGSRLAIALNKFGLAERTQEVAIPLAEVRDSEGNSPDFSALSELQIVFEWADMQGELTISDLRFASRWEQALSIDAPAQLADLAVPEGFTIAALATDLPQLTQIVFTPQGEMLVSLQNGRIWWYHGSVDGGYTSRHLYAAGMVDTVGLLYDPVDGAVWSGGRGQLRRLSDHDGDGVADQSEMRVDGLPWGRHQNNGMVWNPDPDPFSGEPGGSWIYFGLGSTGDLEEGGALNSTVLRFPRQGQSAADLEVVSSGNRNPYMLVWAQVPLNLQEADGPAAWQLFASENGPDFNDAPDEVNHIRWQHHFGFPHQFGPVEPQSAEGDPYSGPLYPVTAHASASGLAYVSNPLWPAADRTLYVSLFGQVFDEAIVGHKVSRISLRQVDTAAGPTYRGEPSDFITGLDRPLPLATDLDGNLLVGDYATGVIYRVTYTP